MPRNDIGIPQGVGTTSEVTGGPVHQPIHGLDIMIERGKLPSVKFGRRGVDDNLKIRFLGVVFYGILPPKAARLLQTADGGSQSCRHDKFAPTGDGVVMRWTMILMLVLPFFITSTASADDSSVKAKAAFSEGRELFKANDFKGAADAFRQAHKLAPSWKLLYNIGQSEAAATRYGLALEAFERYLARGGDEIESERQKEVLEEVDRLRRMVGSVEVTAPRGCLIVVDDVERGRAPLSGSLMISAGVEHRVVVKKVDEILVDRIVRVSGGQKTTIEVKDKPSAEPAPDGPEEKSVEEPEQAIEEAGPSPEESPKERSNLWKAGWAVTAVGGAVLIGGGIVGGAMLSSDSDLVKKCDDGVCDPEERDALDKRDNLALTADILYVVGGAAVVAGVIMVIVGAKNGEKEEDRDVAFTPSAGPGFVGAALKGRF